MFGDFVKCNNCESENMKVALGSEICPICGAIGMLAWVDEENPEVEVDDSEILEIKPHIYHPGHDAYDTYQCSNCGLFNTAYGDYSRKNTIIKSESLDLDDISFNFIEKDDDGFLKFYNLKDSKIIYVELCPIDILKNIIKLYGNTAEYSFSRKEYSGEEGYYRNTEYVLNLDVNKNSVLHTYRIHSDNIEDNLNEIERIFFNEILK